jgi:hypothetical protein
MVASKYVDRVEDDPVCQRFLALAILCLIRAVFPSIGSCQETQDKAEDAAAVIEKTANLYRNLRSYQLERTTRILESKDGAEPKRIVELKFTTATVGADAWHEGDPILPMNYDRCRFNMEIGGNQLVSASGDEFQWWYSSQENTYKKRKSEESSVLGSVGGSMQSFLHMFPLTTLEKGVVQDARIVRKETIEVDKLQRPCYVIEGRAKSYDISAQAARILAAATTGKQVDPPEAPKFLGLEGFLNILQAPSHMGDGDQRVVYSSKAMPTKLTLWIDKSQYLLVRTEMTATLEIDTWSIKEKPKEPNKEEMNVTLTDSFTRLKINEDVPKELFEFTPPVGAKDITQESSAKPK